MTGGATPPAGPDEEPESEGAGANRRQRRYDAKVHGNHTPVVMTGENNTVNFQQSDSGRRRRPTPHSRTLRVSVGLAIAALIAAIGAIATVYWFPDDDPVPDEVKAQTEVSRSHELRDGDQTTVKVKGETSLPVLRLTFKVDESYPDTQSCLGNTTLDIELVGGPDPPLRDWNPDEPVELKVGTVQSDISVLVTLRNSMDSACRIDVRVGKAAFGDGE